MNELEYQAFTDFIHTLLYEKMDEDDYKYIMEKLGTNCRNGRFRTICHHANAEDGGYNLAFIPSTRTFYCHSGCECSYSLLSLIKKNRELNGEKSNTFTALKWLCSELNIPFNFKDEIAKINTNIYKWQNKLGKYLKGQDSPIELKVYDKTFLNMFEPCCHTDWLDYGISQKVLDKYNIRWYNYRSQIVIPCYRENGDLIGARIRNINPDIVPKYMPLELLNGTQFKFPTNEVFYGENFVANNVQRLRQAILVEAEKTVMKYESWYGADNNICLGLFGSTLGKTQLKKLVEWGVETVYIALDSDFDTIEYSNDIKNPTPYERCEDKIMKIYNLLKPYFKVYVIYNNLGFENCYKFSITDYTKEQYEQLWESKERITDDDL